MGSPIVRHAAPLASSRLRKTEVREPRKARAVRVEDELWDAAKDKADERGETLSEVIRAALERYVKRK